MIPVLDPAPQPSLPTPHTPHPGACTAKGAPEGFPAPWAITLATNGVGKDAPPAVRSIGIQASVWGVWGVECGVWGVGCRVFGCVWAVVGVGCRNECSGVGDEG